MGAYLPQDWPDGVRPPGSEEFEESAVAWLLDVLPPDYRRHPVLRRYPAALASEARYYSRACVEAAREGYRTARVELGVFLPPHAVERCPRGLQDGGVQARRHRTRGRFGRAGYPRRGLRSSAVAPSTRRFRCRTVRQEPAGAMGRAAGASAMLSANGPSSSPGDQPSGVEFLEPPAEVVGGVGRAGGRRRYAVPAGFGRVLARSWHATDCSVQKPARPLNYDQFVRLFTPVSSADASLLERGVTLNGPLYWIDRLVSEEAEEDAIWVVLAVPDEEVAAFEQSGSPLQGYREFELPPALPARFPVNRVADD